MAQARKSSCVQSSGVPIHQYLPCFNPVLHSKLLRYNETQNFELSTDDYHDYQTQYLPDRIEKAAIVSKGGYLYYIAYDTLTLVKFHISSNITVTRRSLIGNVGKGDTYSYSGGERSSLDLEIDESGLWVIYSTAENQGLLVFSQINTTTLKIEATWYGHYPKKSVGNCFVICGTFYCTSSHESHNAKVNYYYNTKTNEEGFMNVPFDSKYGDIKSIKYNPYEQKLYAWDKGHAVVYDMIFEL
ncbi:myocilin-like [Amphiura filiformis]|uniref:myocilin-like n=1 Tax=Amphiura filiformis TaxID=82378 RepID=UPI003B227040